jgi:hypothetical protein
MKLRVVVPIVVAMSVGSAAGDDYARVPLHTPMLSQLVRGESAEIRITHIGCFGGSSFQLDFTGPMPVHVTVAGGSRPGARDFPPIGETTLSVLDALRVDRVLAYYRAGPKPALCTSHIYVRVKWQRRDGTTEEHWSYDSCGDSSDPGHSIAWIIGRARLATFNPDYGRDF